MRHCVDLGDANATAHPAYCLVRLPDPTHSQSLKAYLQGFSKRRRPGMEHEKR